MLLYFLSGLAVVAVAAAATVATCSKRQTPHPIRLWESTHPDSIEREVQRTLGSTDYELLPSTYTILAEPNRSVYTVYLFHATPGTTILTTQGWTTFYAISDRTCVLVDQSIPHSPNTQTPFAQFTAFVPLLV